MRNLILTAICCLIYLCVQGQDGVHFRTVTFDEALKAAKAEKKLVFVDCYTKWCGPCQKMAKKVFPQKEAGDYFNSRFICVKYDTQEGEGIRLKKKFKVSAYPTFVILNPEGNEIGRIEGGSTLGPFIEKIEKKIAVNRTFCALDSRYSKKGRLNSRKLMQYYQILLEKGKVEEADRIYLELGKQMKRKEKFDPVFWPYFTTAPYDSEDFRNVRDHIGEFSRKNGREKVEGFLYSVYTRQIFQMIFLGLPQNPKAFEEELQQLQIEKQAQLLSAYRMAGMAVRKDPDGFMACFNDRSSLDKEGMDIAFYSVQKLQKTASRQQLEALAGILQKMIAQKPDKEMKKKLVAWQKDFRRRASTGTSFEEMPFAEALKMAKILDKKLFLDCYTTWCGPCKYMLKHVFNQEKVGRFINNRFIPLKVDMGKGDGPVIKKLFGIKAYPTFLIVNPDGSLYHKTVGEDEAEKFIRRLDIAPGMASSCLEKRYLQGDRDKRFMISYIRSLKETYSEKAGDITEELYNSLTAEEKTDSGFWFIFKDAQQTNDTAKKGFVLANKKAFYNNIGERAVDGYLAFENMATVQYIFSHSLAEVKKRSEELRSLLSSDWKKIAGMKLATERRFRAIFNTARSFLSGNLRTAVSSCRRNIQDMEAEDIPFSVLVNENGGAETFSPQDRRLLVSLGRILLQKAQDREPGKDIEKLVRELESKTGSSI